MSLTRTLTKTRDKKTKEDALVIHRLLDLGNVPLKFRGCSVEQIPEKCGYRKVITDWRDNIHSYIEEGRWLYLSGPYGTGKTGAGAILLKEALLHDGSAFMLTQNELVDYKLNSENVPFGQYSLEEVIRDANILMIDDVGSSRNKDIIIELLEWVCVTRYNNDRSLIITTNLEPEGDEIKEFLTGKVLSMTMEKAQMISVSQHDWRAALRDEKDGD